MTGVATVKSPDDFKGSGRSVIMFVASFHDACKPGGQMDTVFTHLASTSAGGAAFLKVDAEELSDLAEEFGVEVVPTVVFVVDRKVVDKVEGAHPAKISEKLQQFCSTAAKSDNEASSTTPVFKRIDSLLSSSYVFLFMKGTPENPKCKFSRKILEILSQTGVKNFGTFDVLSDEAIRQGLKEYANWPTFPQLYAGGKLVGGVDIVEELQKEGDLVAALSPVVQEIKGPLQPPQVITKKASLEERLEKLINQSPIMLFMKGSPDGPQCGFSAQIVSIMNGAGVAYGHFDILTDDIVRQGLKEYSNWPTYPQVYANGKLVGGLDIIRDLAEDGSLAEALSS